jgi:hypothetical protein
MNNPLAGTDPTGYCGTRIKGHIAAGCGSIGEQDLPKGTTDKIATAVHNSVVGALNNGAGKSQPSKKADVKVNEINSHQRVGEEEEEVSTSGAATATALAIPLRATATATAGESTIGRVLTANPILTAVAAMVYSPGLNEGEDEAIAQIRSESKVEDRKQSPVIVIGETQKRVEAMASILRKSGLNVETILQDWPKNLLPSNNLDGSLEFNRQWINEKMNKNYTIYDVGFDPTRKNNRSIFYQLERNEIDRRGYTNRLGVRLKE